MAFEHFAVKSINADFCLLARMQIGQLGFLEIGFDIGAVSRHQRHQARAALHELAGLNRAVRHGAIERRANAGEGKITLRLGQRCVQFSQSALGLDPVCRDYVYLRLCRQNIGLRLIDRSL